jgi:tRNA(Ile)-lysidine synthase TilS/MesJ
MTAYSTKGGKEEKNMAIRCSRCVLPETIPHINFDENGVCNYCREYDDNKNYIDIDYGLKGEKFRRLVDEAIRKRLQYGSKYDALVPVSGGRDSSYVAWELSKTLKILCVHYDNPFSSAQTKVNVDRLVKTIKADLITFNHPNDRHVRSFRSNLKAWLKRPELATMGLMCLACKPMYLEFFRIARRNKIRFIIDGSNPNEATTFKIEAQGGRGTKSPFSWKAMTNVGGKAARNWRYLRTCNAMPAIHTLLSLNGNTPYLKWKYPEIRKIGYFYFFPYHEKEINDRLRNIGWEKARDNKSPWRFDCEIDSLKNYLFQKVIGATEKDDLFSKNIRWGLMTRQEAMDRLGEGDVNIEIVERVLAKIQMKLSDLRDILTS